MPARTAPCPSCGAPVPTELLACPSCGTAVAPPESGTGVVIAADVPDAEAPATPSFVLPWATPDADAEPVVAAAAAPDPEEALPSASPAADPIDERTVEAGLGAPTDPDTLQAPEPTASLDGALPAMHAPVLTSASMGGSSRAGAYLPPSPVRSAPGGAAPQPTSATSYGYGRSADEVPSQGAWPPPSVWPPATMPAGAPAAPSDVRDVAEPARPLRPGHASLLSDLPFDPPDDLAGWLVAAGSIGGAIAFLLPWSPQVLGSPNFGTEYWGQWGLGAPSHLAPFLLVVALAMLTILPNALPAWLKTGVLPLVMGAFLIGLLWPYLVGGFGSRIGATVEAFAAFLLIGGGVVAIAPHRERSNEGSPGS